jgi:hypothetical protein
MKTMRALLFVVVSCCAAHLCSVSAAQEIKYPSPDGRFALRITQPENDEYHPTVELVEKQSGKVLVTLHDGSDTDLFDSSECILVWSTDSKQAAYGFQASPPGVRILSLGALVCFWNGSGFDKVFLPENLPDPDIKFPKGKEENVKPYGGGVKPLRWLKSGDLEMSSEDMMLSRDDGKSYTGMLRFTLSFDAQHRASVKNVGKTKTQMEE